MSLVAEKTDINAATNMLSRVAKFYDDPLGFVKFVFPWGEGDLEGHTGPDIWQAEILEDFGKHIREGKGPYQCAVAAGHGIGKGALSAFLLIFLMSTRRMAGIVSANTKQQLETKTWRELALWNSRSILKPWFEWTATKFYHVEEPETWYISAIPWSEKNSEAFAGLHAEHAVILFDEASSIPPVIWEVAEGGMTGHGDNTESTAAWFVFGNPTRNTGRFRECFGKNKHRWVTHQIDSRTAKMTDKLKLNQWVEDYGEDSDFVKVRVRGTFPSASSMQFISGELVEDAFEREAKSYLEEPLILSCDIARYGDDMTVFCFRRGRDARTIEWKKYRGLDTMQIAARISELAGVHQVDTVFIDEGGIGAGVYDRCRQLHVSNCIGVNFGSKSESATYNNKRAQMWGNMRDWLEGGSIPDDRDLMDDLTGLEYSFTANNKIQLEKKEDMKRRGLSSPDCGDALALSFAYPVAPRGLGIKSHAMARKRRDYDPLAKKER